MSRKLCIEYRGAGSDRLPTLRDALLGKEIGTRQGTLPVVGARFPRTPPIALSGGILALCASEWLASLIGFGTTTRLAPRMNLHSALFAGCSRRRQSAHSS